MGNPKFFDPQIIAFTHVFCDLMKNELILGLLTYDLNAFPFCTRDLVNIRNILAGLLMPKSLYAYVVL